MLQKNEDAIPVGSDVSSRQCVCGQGEHPALAGPAKAEGSKLVGIRRRTASKSRDLANSPTMKGCNNLASFNVKRRRMRGLFDVLGGYYKKEAIHCFILCSHYSEVADIYRAEKLAWLLRKNF